MQEPVANASVAITPNGPSTQPNSPKPKKKGHGWRIAGIIFLLLLLGAAGAGGYYYLQILQEQQREEERYASLLTLTDPEYFQQFLTDFPQSSHCDDVRRRMESLLQENDDWKAMLNGVSRNSVTQFMEKHPQSARRCICENMLDSIDWADAVKEETPEAIDRYLSLHPEGQHITEAASTKNDLAKRKITAEDKALVRGALSLQ